MSNTEQHASPLWIVVDDQTGMQVGKSYKSNKRARSRADRLDQQYGAYRYSAQMLITND